MKDVSEKSWVVRAALFEGQRRKVETLSQLAVRRDQEFAGTDRCLTIPYIQAGAEGVHTRGDGGVFEARHAEPSNPHQRLDRL